MKVRFTQLGSLQFLSTNILQSSVATHLRCGGILITAFPEVTAKSVGKIFLEIG